MWQLSTSQYEHTVAITLGIDITLPRITVTSRMENFINYTDGTNMDNIFFATLKEDLFTLISDNLNTITTNLPCTLDNLDETYLSQYLRPLLLKAHHTDTTPTEPYLNLFTNLVGEQKQHNAFASTLVAILLSPKAFFRTQLKPKDNTDVTTLTPFKLTKYLSYIIWNRPPNDTLLTTAQDSTLADPKVFTNHLDHMLDSPKGNHNLIEFLSQ